MKSRMACGAFWRQPRDAGPVLAKRWPASLLVDTTAIEACVNSSILTSNHHSSRARNLILLIGDGMGQAHRFAGQLFAAGREGRLAMDRLPYSGQMGTMCVDPSSFVTDSAAAATAIATGVKTCNGCVAIDPMGQERATILELAKASGRSTGLISTCQITDATPAAFAAHVPMRAAQSEIARQYIERARVDVILGGGAVHWYPDGQPLPPQLCWDAPWVGAGKEGDLVARAGFNCKVGTDASYNEAKLRMEDLEQLVRGGSVSPPAANPDAKWDKIADRPPLMLRLETAQKEHLGPAMANAGAFRKSADAVLREAELIAAIGEVIGQEGFEFADDETYLGYAHQMRDAAREIVGAIKSNDYDTARAASGKLEKACNECHEGYRS